MLCTNSTCRVSSIWWIRSNVRPPLTSARDGNQLIAACCLVPKIASRFEFAVQDAARQGKAKRRQVGIFNRMEPSSQCLPYNSPFTDWKHLQSTVHAIALRSRYDRIPIQTSQEELFIFCLNLHVHIRSIHMDIHLQSLR